MSRSLRVGIFVALGILVSVAVIFVIGDNRRFWDPKLSYFAEFEDVAGLRAGAPVRMGGVDIGTVAEVAYDRDPKSAKIKVRLAIARSDSSRVRADSVVTVVNKGLLGDKMIKITPGDGKLPQLGDMAQLQTREPLDLDRYVDKIESILQKTEKTVANLETATHTAADPKLGEDLKGAVASLNTILGGVANNKDGVAYRVLFDPKTGERFDRLLGNVDGITAQMNAVSGDLRDMTLQIKNGPGLGHAVLYDAKLAGDLSGIASETRQGLEAMRTGKGLAHSVIYGDAESQTAMVNLGATMQDIRHIVAQIRAGKGTLGAFLVDPSVYEDIKQLVGNVDRSQVLRAFVRYSIREDEAKRKDGPPPKAEPPK